MFKEYINYLYIINGMSETNIYGILILGNDVPQRGNNAYKRPQNF
jgi:hypothetical protein